MKSHSKLAALAALLCASATTLAVRAAPPSLDHSQVENIVKRSYQYVAMYNVINKTALAPLSNPIGTGGWNKLKLNTELFDADVKSIARPNNDSLYQLVVLNLCDEPMILDVPAFDSKNVSLETSAYDHYCDIPVSTRQGDFKKPQKLLFFTARTKAYKAGQKIRGIDRYVEMSGDFAVAFFRVMPHASDPVRFKRIIGQIQSLRAVTLSEYNGGPAKPPSNFDFPKVGETDADVFGNNLLEVMQFVFNHSSFDPTNELDQAVLATYKPLGVEPGKDWNAAVVSKIDGALFRQVAEGVAKANLAILADSSRAADFLPRMFLPKAKMDLDALVLQSVIGPIGQPASEALYPPVNTADGRAINALHDYVIKMKKADLPPAKAFWSLTLYDTKNGFFVPNEYEKYSVGENAGFRLDAEGGIEIHVAAEKPTGVPPENWLPINRKDEDLDIVLRIYVPDLEAFKIWKAPKAVLVR